MSYLGLHHRATAFCGTGLADANIMPELEKFLCKFDAKMPMQERCQNCGTGIAYARVMPKMCMQV